MSKRASSHKLFPVLLIVGWIVGCTAVVYFVFIFAWKTGARGRH
ncbi:sarcoplasmic/endoplasmic reticulum calcium ATPase regulator DWORF-like [Trematomus bernacchii]|nr:sarcoplasmic/endoplasmic reticulum calcium ATPase regulator DWORF-like [Trematomus bernacchii]